MMARNVMRQMVLLVWGCSVAGVIYLSVLPHIELPVDFWNADKLYHLLAYAWLGGLPQWGFADRRRGRGAAYAMVFLGALLECVQASIPGRSASTADALANAVGVFLGIWLVESIWPRLRPQPDRITPN